MLIFVSRAIKKVVRGQRQGFLGKYYPKGVEIFSKTREGLTLPTVTHVLPLPADTKSTVIHGSMR